MPNNNNRTAPSNPLPNLGEAYLTQKSWITSFELLGPSSDIILSSSRDKSVLLSSITFDQYSSQFTPIKRYTGFSNIVSDVSTYIPSNYGSSETPQIFGNISSSSDSLSSLNSLSNGFFIASSWDKLCRLYKFDCTEKVSLFKGSSSGLICCSISPDGKWLLTGGFDHNLKVWDIGKNEEIHSFGESNEGHKGWVNGAKFLPSKSFFVGSNELNKQEKLIERKNEMKDGELSFISIGEDSFLKHFRLRQTASSSSFNDSNSNNATNTSENEISNSITQNNEKNSIIKDIAAHEEAVISCAVSSNGKFCATGSKDRTAMVFDVSDASEMNPIERFKAGDIVQAIDLNTFNNGMVALGAGERVELFDLRNGNEPVGIGVPNDYLTDERGKKYNGSFVTCLKFTRDGKKLVASYSDGGVAVYGVDGEGIGGNDSVKTSGKVSRGYNNRERNYNERGNRRRDERRR